MGSSENERNQQNRIHGRGAEHARIYGGYSVVVEKTVQFYIETTGEWKLKGEDKYCMDAKVFVEKFAKK